ncbi:MAG: Transcriptional regulator [Candidatus Saccharicenans subterraneus]|uniref:Transcriptional regulator n=1 Tax=Candidatus Saccharicenans subterraneus TaxID=2508984 RepID=A0A3E2BLJ9_9BACT|nr:MAG: Transcriptional regulator [Candidatus Saccharicenans subterraneum]
MNELFAARLKKLREESGLTQEELGEAVGLSSEYISLLEAGKRTPSIIALNRISKYFQKNVSYFLETRENPFAVLQADERLNSATKKILARFQKICDEYLELERLTGRHCQLAPLYSGSLSPQNMAEEERRRLGLGNEPIRDIFRLGETNGCRYFRVSLPEEARISGIFIYLEERDAAFALINSNLSPGKQVVAAAHLYCHYLRDRHESPIIDNLDVIVDEYVTLYSPREQFAQSFAARFLIPPSKVRELVERDIKTRRLTYPEVIFLKRYFGVSTPAMLRTLRLMNYLSRSQFENYFKLDHEAEERAIFGDVSVEEIETSEPSPDLVLPERFYLLKKEAELVEEAEEEEAKEKVKSQENPAAGKEGPGREGEEN